MNKFKSTGLALTVLLALAVLFTACPNAAGGGGNGGGSSGGGGTTPPAPEYVKVPYSDLEMYLQNTASSEEVNYIEVTGLQAANLKGTGMVASPLGEKLKAAPDKQVALKLPETVAALTDMSDCFYKCENLVRVEAIPETVTTMSGCFSDCSNLETAPDIPAGVTAMKYCFFGCTKLTGVTLTCDYNPGSGGTQPFKSAFSGCKSLTEGSIKVPQPQLSAYQAAAAVMGTTADKFAAIGAPPAPGTVYTAVLTLSPDKKDITVTVTTADGTPVTVEGCTEPTLTSGAETELHATGATVTLKGNITELKCNSNKLIALDVQGLTALQKLWCWSNKLPALNVQGCTALQRLDCSGNQLPVLDVQGCTALQWLDCSVNQLTALNVQGLTALQYLVCRDNKLTALDVQGLTALETLACSVNQLTDLNVQGLTALQTLDCASNNLTALNVQDCTALKKLRCCGNKLNAAAFTKLFTDLPQREESDKAKCILYEENPDEGNQMNFNTQPDLAAAFNNAKTVKNWKMYKMNASGQEVEI